MSTSPRSPRPSILPTLAALVLVSAFPLMGALASGGPASSAPVPTKEARSTHAPYEAAECSLCHEGRDAKSPGKALQPVDRQCLSCHDDIRDAAGTEGAADAHTRGAGCVRCHNPHNSRRPHLLR